MICSDCVTPEPLKTLIIERGQPAICEYCENEAIAYETKLLFEYVYDRIRENFASEDDLSSFEHGMLYEGGSDEIPVQTIDIVLSEWLELGEEVYFDDIWSGVPSEFNINKNGQTTHFYIDDGLLERNIYEDRWTKFIEDIKHAHRFFNPIARDFLDSVFSSLSTKEQKINENFLRTINKGEMLFRARNGGNYKETKKIWDDLTNEFGPSPKNKAGSQRMTPNGISALYCALDRATCLSEIRSITGDNVVSIALTPTTQLHLLDLTKLTKIEPPKLTFLDIGYLDSLHLKTFINSLVSKMSKPKGRNDELSYISTQVVFEYLRLRFGLQVDGLVFPSVQTGSIGTNVVLFPEASVLSKIIIEKNESNPAYKFEPKAKLAVIADSVRFHKITAIETKATQYDEIHGLFMSELERKRMGSILWQSEE
ncbi:RES domain-containing protein [Pseudomonas sp. NPDC087803]|uniref:RES domain-containing protein n=1 Tax=Pseudomonas sp. NPDC087803 TaxID=3364448 RepID=UPI0037FD54E8